jgi:hypothetical protein
VCAILPPFPQALRLADSLDPGSIPGICLSYAEQLHNHGEYKVRSMRDGVDERPCR